MNATHTPSTHTLHTPYTQVVVSVSTNDVIRQVMPDFVVRHTPGAPKPDRITSVMNQLLQQRSLYPLFPPGEGSQLEVTQQDKLALAVTPDVMILGSKLNRMAKMVQNTLCVIPGRLAVGKTGGTYAKLAINPYKESAVSMHAAAKSGADSLTRMKEAVSHDVAQRTKVSVVRI